jgi:hypothetical protein
MTSRSHTDLRPDSAFETVAPDDFPSMIQVPRYGRRTDAFDDIISATEDHFWDPNDPRYIDYDQAFDLGSDLVVPREFVPELNSAVIDKLDEGQQVTLGNELARFYLSQLLHGEQGALSLSASLCTILADPGTQEYAANQVREEARHVNAVHRYILQRWGDPLPCSGMLGDLMTELVNSQEVYKKQVGMQILIEGMALGTFAFLHTTTRDPLLRRLVALLTTDESFHHRFGKEWAHRTLPDATPEQHNAIEDFALKCVRTLIRNSVYSEQKRFVYEKLGLDGEWVRGALREALTDPSRHAAFSGTRNSFRVVLKTLFQAGIITERTRASYTTWFNMDAVNKDADGIHAQAIMDEILPELREINSQRRKIGAAASI